MWQAAQTHADQLHNQHRTNPVADDAVPLTEPWWTHQVGDAGHPVPISYDHLFTRRNAKKLSHSS